MAHDKSTKLLFIGIAQFVAIVVAACWVLADAKAKINDFWSFVKDVLTNPLFLAVYLLVGVALWVCRDDLVKLLPKWARRRESKKDEPKPAFEVRPICGDTLLAMLLGTEKDVAAKIGVKNISGKPLKGCFVKLIGSYFIRHGYVFGVN